jgi:transitional endoplasmic reticulum ATPase
VILKVLGADPNLVGKKVAAIDNESRAILGLTHDDYVLIKGKKETLAKVWPGRASEEGQKIIRIDTPTRDSAGVTLGDPVVVKKAVLVPAKKITFAPIAELAVKLESYKQALKKEYNQKPFIVGDQALLKQFGTSVTILVQSTMPKGAVMLVDETEVEVLNEPVDPNNSNIAQVSYEDIGGIKKQLGKIKEMIELPLKHPEIFNHLGIEPPKGVLLYGPPGTGKTLIAKAVACESGAHIITVKGPEIMSRFVGGAEQKIRDLFKEAQENSPSIIFIDEIDAIAPIREEVAGDVEKRVVAQLLSLMDGMEARGQIIVIATTNRPNSIDTALRRPGRFDREIEIGAPDYEGRVEILNIMTRNAPIKPNFKKEYIKRALDTNKSFEKKKEDFVALEESFTDNQDENEKLVRNFISKTRLDIDDVYKIFFDGTIQDIANSTRGFVGADLSALVREAAMQTIKRVKDDPKYGLNLESVDAVSPDRLDVIRINYEDFLNALKDVNPSALREVFAEIPNVRFEDVGGLDHVKDEIKKMVELPLKHYDNFEKIGITPIKGILLYGPPGTGKTMLAKAIANECEANFISVRGPEIFNKWLGESERAIRNIFQKARQATPCIVFFDEIDAIAPGRSFDSNPTTARVVNQLLTELDGMGNSKGVVFLAATNKLEDLDSALIRPGRIDLLLKVGLADEKGRLDILERQSRNMLLKDKNDLQLIARETDNFSGADLNAILREAALISLEQNDMKSCPITMQDLQKALGKLNESKKNLQEQEEKKKEKETNYIR